MLVNNWYILENFQNLIDIAKKQVTNWYHNLVNRNKVFFRGNFWKLPNKEWACARLNKLIPESDSADLANCVKGNGQ